MLRKDDGRDSGFDGISPERASVSTAGGTADTKHALEGKIEEYRHESACRQRNHPRNHDVAIWVVDTGSPVLDASTTVMAAARVAQYPRVGVRSVMSLPIVRITR